MDALDAFLDELRAAGSSVDAPAPSEALQVLFRDGSEVRAQKSDYMGFARSRPLDWDGAMQKFVRLAGPELDSGLLREIPQAVRALDQVQASELARLLGRAGRERGVRASA